MGLFDEFEGSFSDIPDPVMGLPEGVHKCVVADVTTEDKDSGKYLVFTYTCTEGTYEGRSHREFQRFIVGSAMSEADKQTMGYVKSRLASLGVPVERMNSLDRDEILGTEIVLTLVPQKNNPNYRNVSRLTLVDPTNVVPTLGGSPTSAGAIDTAPVDVDNPFA